MDLGIFSRSLSRPHQAVSLSPDKSYFQGIFGKQECLVDLLHPLIFIHQLQLVALQNPSESCVHILLGKASPRTHASAMAKWNHQVWVFSKCVVSLIFTQPPRKKHAKKVFKILSCCSKKSCKRFPFYLLTYAYIHTCNKVYNIIYWMPSCRKTSSGHLHMNYGFSFMWSI